MTYLPSLPADATLLQIFRAHPTVARPLLDFHEAVMRGPSPLTVAQRELIAAFVSGLNACGYCHGVHGVTAQEFGIPEHVLTGLLQDVDTADVEERLKPLLRYVAKVTRQPSMITPTDAQDVLDAGWEEQALHDAVAVCGLFNMMNRYVDGLGVTASVEYHRLSGERLRSGYAALKDLL